MSLASLLDCHNIMATQRFFQDGSLAIGFNLGRKENEKVLHSVKNTSGGAIIIIATHLATTARVQSGINSA
jgi:hypothetical protein